jgi:glycerol uptake facilitator-like aquaporin
MNPLITIATFFAQLCSLPRLLLYVAFQIIGAALAGLLVRAALGTHEFKVGGCWLDTNEVPVSSAVVVELMACLVLVFVAFGVGLDPRQAKAIGPVLSPVLIGLALGTLSFGFGFPRYGYGGASMNPARCFGVFVGSSFPEWHWHHW